MPVIVGCACCWMNLWCDVDLMDDEQKETYSRILNLVVGFFKDLMKSIVVKVEGHHKGKDMEGDEALFVIHSRQSHNNLEHGLSVLWTLSIMTMSS